MNDDDLKTLVEQEYSIYHLEYVEIGRKEYLKRGFENETEEEEEQEEVDEKRYPALRTIAGIYFAFAWIIGGTALIGALYLGGEHGQAGLLIAIPILIFGALIVLGVLAVSESIKVFIDIEANTRKHSDL
ncbi:MAG: hypothetical protein KF734_18270 [Saprospiraceae bacterium]|nr:hypothetical protein [Saprospiraceae bacterium]